MEKKIDEKLVIDAAKARGQIFSWKPVPLREFNFVPERKATRYNILTFIHITI